MPTQAPPENDERTQAHYDEMFNDLTSGLRDAEDGQIKDLDDMTSGTADSSAEDRNINAARDALADKEEQGSTDPRTAINHQSKVTPKDAVKSISKLRKFGPAGGIGGTIIGGLVAALMGSIGPGSLLINLKEVFVTNLDQQNISAEVRSQKLLAKRLAGQTTSGSCGAIKILCRFEKPSNKMLKNLDEAGIKAMKDGKIIDKQSFLNGTRPDHYKLPDGKEVSAANFSAELRSNPEFRAAFRKAYNPRWANWVDKVATRFLGERGLSRLVPKAFGDAGDSKAAQAAVNDLSKGEQQGQNAIEAAIKKESTDFAEKAGKTAKKGHGDAILTTIQLGCVASKIPGVVSKVMRGYRMAQMAKVLFIFLTLADKIKAGDATPTEVENAGNMLTQAYKQTDGSVLSAMDAGGMKYALLGDVGAATAAASKQRITKFVPGSVGKGFGPFAAIGQNKNLNTVCSAAGSTEAQVAMDTLKLAKGTNPVGWVMLAVDAGVFIADKTGALDTFISFIVGQAMGFINSVIDWKTVLGFFMGDITKDVAGLDLGEMVSISGAGTFADMAASTNAPLTPDQKTEYNKLVAEPVRLAWAEEDRATHSPFDASNPNTFLGSIVARIMPYSSGFSTPMAAMASVTNISTSIFGNFIAPKSYASSVNTNMCQDDYSIMVANVAAGPLCDVQYGIPTSVIDLDPVEVIKQLFDAKQIDEEGNPVKDSDLETWISSCTGADTLMLSDCIIPAANAAATAGKNALQALFPVFVTDKRLVDSMDEEPAAIAALTSSTGGVAVPGSGAAIGDYKPGSYQCAAWVGQHILPDIYGIPNPGGNGNAIAPNLGGMGYKVDNIPAVHSIVSYPANCSGCGHGSTQYGHVAVVYAVNTDGSIEIEDYNGTGRETYTTSHVPADVVPRLLYAHVEAKFNTGPVKIGG